MPRKQPEVEQPEVELRFVPDMWAKRILKRMREDGRMDGVDFGDEDPDGTYWYLGAEGSIADAVGELFAAEDTWELRVGGRLVQGEEYDP